MPTAQAALNAVTERRSGTDKKTMATWRRAAQKRPVLTCAMTGQPLMSCCGANAAFQSVAPAVPTASRELAIRAPHAASWPLSVCIDKIWVLDHFHRPFSEKLLQALPGTGRPPSIAQLSCGSCGRGSPSKMATSAQKQPVLVISHATAAWIISHHLPRGRDRLCQPVLRGMDHLPRTQCLARWPGRPGRPV